MTHAVIEQIGTHPKRDAVDKYLWHAAQCGHYELTRFLIDTAVDKSYLISRALQADQYGTHHTKLRSAAEKLWKRWQ